DRDASLVVGTLHVEPAAYTARVRGVPVDLRPREFELLVRLTRDAGRVVTREQLMADVWDEHWDGSTKTLDMHVLGLRRKLDAPTTFAVYDAAGERVFGRGPRRADDIVRRALRGRAASSDDAAILVATPIVDTRSEEVRGVLRVTESLDGAERRAFAWYAAMV